MTNNIDALGELASVIDRLSKQLDDMDKEDENKGMHGEMKGMHGEIDARRNEGHAQRHESLISWILTEMEIKKNPWKKHLKTVKTTMTIETWTGQRKNPWKN